jgi:MFS family permease
MGWMPLLAELVDGQWRPGIGDPTVVGWLTVVAYLVAAVCCGRAAWREPTPGGRRRSRPAIFWLSLSAMMVLLGLNKQLDLQSFFTFVGRRVLTTNGWYQGRRHLQAIFIGGIAAACLVLLGISLWFARRSLRHRWLALIGMASVMGFVVIRAASFHHVDALLASRLGGMKWNWIIELGGVLIVAVGALCSGPVKGAAPLKRSKLANHLTYIYRDR